ncbi:MAG: acyl carrier protein [Candidatus Poribacteria bacterium]|nr:acyl carrier protein [Candidatus Poribacteria bacterium]
MAGLADKVCEIIARELSVNVEQVTLNSSFMDDLGADSLDTVELVMAFEEEFEIDIPDADAEKIRVVQDAIEYLTKATGGGEDATPV